jgi:uncharacterized protein
MGTQLVNDAHRHLGKMPAFPFYGGPPCHPDILARGTAAELIADLDREGVERALVLPNYGVPDASVSFGFNPLVLEAAAADDRIRCGLWVSPRPQDAELNTAALALAGEQGVAALKSSSTGSSTRRGSTAWSCTCTPRPAGPPTSTRSACWSTATPTT